MAATAPGLTAVEQPNPIAANRPEVLLTITPGATNLVGPVDDSFETGIGTAVNVANCVVVQSNAQALDGTQSLKGTAIAVGDMSWRQGPYPVSALATYTWMASYIAGSLGRTARADIEWYNGASLLSTTAGTAVSDLTTGWTQSIATAAAPATTTQCYIVHNFLAMGGTGEQHFTDQVGLFAGTVTGWQPGGPVGAIIERSDGAFILGGSSNVLLGADATPGPTLGAGSWTPVSGSVTMSPVAAPDAGSESLHLTSGSTNADYYVSAPFTIQPSTAYVFEAEVWVGSITGQALDNRAIYMSDDTGVTAEADGLTPSILNRQWVPFAVPVVTGPAATTLTLRLYSPNGSVYWRNPSLTIPTTLSVPTAAAVTTLDVSPFDGPLSYTAWLVFGTQVSLPSTPAALNLGYSPNAVSLWNFLPQFLRDTDTANGFIFLAWLDGIVQQEWFLDGLFRDTPQGPGWSSIMDPTRCPTFALPWLAQLVGVRFTPQQAASDASMRAAIEAEGNWGRGTPAFILAAIDAILKPGYFASLVERDTSPYHLQINIPAAGLSQPARYEDIYTAPYSYPTYASLFPTAFPLYSSLWYQQGLILIALAASVPGGIMYHISFT